MPLIIKDWDSYQHYKTRRPCWIKLYVNMIEEYNDHGVPKTFFLLPDAAKLTFIMLLCVASKYGGRIPREDEPWLKNATGLHQIDIKTLINHGYLIKVDAVDRPVVNGSAASLSDDDSISDRATKKDTLSTVIADVLALDKEKEKEKEPPYPPAEGDRSPKKKDSEYTKDFVVFWSVYPNKVGKDVAYRKYQLAKKRGATASEMLDAIKAQIASNHFVGTDGNQYVPHPSTWLNQGRWKDSLKNQRAPEKQPSYVTVCVVDLSGKRDFRKYPNNSEAEKDLSARGYLYDDSKHQWALRS